MIYPNSIATLENDLAAAPDTVLTALACDLVKYAKIFDLEKLKTLGINGRIKGLSRNYTTPPDYTHDTVLGASWADRADEPLKKGERWNEGRRATLTGASYKFNALGHPINPYMETGINGRGLLGQFGPNNAVDNGALVVKDDEAGQDTLYAIGILRKFDNDAPAFSGGFAKYSFNEAGSYTFDRDAVIETQMEEFFEEMISGSIDLMPEYHRKLEQDIELEVTRREQALNGRKLSAEALHEIREQAETGLKMEQVKDRDPEFLTRLKGVIAQGHECFAGPVLNDNRNTNNAWIESRLSWFLMDDDAWNMVKGDDPVFDYRLSAGDDASGVVLHRIDSNLVKTAYASHGAMFTFMMASYLLNAQKNGIAIGDGILGQAKDITEFLKTSRGNVPEPSPSHA